MIGCSDAEDTVKWALGYSGTLKQLSEMLCFESQENIPTQGPCYSSSMNLSWGRVRDLYTDLCIQVFDVALF